LGGGIHGDKGGRKEEQWLWVLGFPLQLNGPKKKWRGKKKKKIKRDGRKAPVQKNKEVSSRKKKNSSRKR